MKNLKANAITLLMLFINKTNKYFFKNSLINIVKTK